MTSQQIGEKMEEINRLIEEINSEELNKYIEEMQKAMEKLDLLVVVDPYPTMSAVMSDKKDGVYLLPASTQFETYGSVTASNRSIQWREKVVEPLFESLPDHTIMAKFAKKFGFEKEFLKNIKVDDKDEPLIEDVTREFNKGMWTIGYTGQSPERIKAHMAYQHHFDKTTLQAVGGPNDGEYYGMPWPCWGTPEMKHPGTPNLYDMSKPVSKGGLTFRARFGVERDGDNLLAEGVYSVGSDIQDGYPEFTMQMLMDLGWDSDLTDDERAAVAAHIEACATCREDLALCEEMARAVRSDSAVPIPPATSADALLRHGNTRASGGWRSGWSLAAAVAIVSIAGVLVFLQIDGTEPANQRFTTTTETTSLATVDYVFRLRFDASADTQARRRVIEELGGSVQRVDGVTDEYRLTLSLPPQSLTDLDGLADDIAARDEVIRADVVAVQVPVK